MNSVRFLAAAALAVGATLAACSGNFGAGTTPPQGLLPSGNLAGVQATASPTPSSASNIVTYGSTTAFQALPNAAGYGGAIAFGVPSPKPSGFSDIAIGATLSRYAPSDVPDLNLLTKNKKGAKRERSARALAFVTLLATRDITLEAFPRLAIDVPRDIVTVYHENEFGLALYNAGAKDTTFRLAVAELDAATPPPTPSAFPSAPGAPSAIPLSVSPGPSASATAVASAAAGSPTPRAPGSAAAGATGPASGSPGPGGFSAGGGPAASPTLPPQRISFVGTAQPLKLYANRPAVFALYALPLSTPSPSPRKSGATAEPEVSASPVTGGSAAPAASGAASSAPGTAAPGSAAPSAAASAGPAATAQATR